MRRSEDNSVESSLCFHVYHWVLGMELGLSGSKHIYLLSLFTGSRSIFVMASCLTIYLELFNERGGSQEAWVLPSRSLQRKAHQAQGHPFIQVSKPLKALSSFQTPNLWGV